MAKYCRKPSKKCVPRRKKKTYGKTCRRPLKVKICRKRKRTFRTKSALGARKGPMQKLGRTIHMRID